MGIKDWFGGEKAKKKEQFRDKVKAAVHWVSARHSVSAPVRLYDRLFSVDNPEAAAGEDGDPRPELGPSRNRACRCQRAVGRQRRQRRVECSAR